MVGALPAILYCTKLQYKTPLVAPIGKEGEPIPHIAFVDRAQSVEHAIKEYLFDKYKVVSIDIKDDGVEWVIHMDVQSPFLTKSLLSMVIMYVFEIVPMRKHGWLYVSATDMYGSIARIDDIRRTRRVELFEYFMERKITIRHPRMS